MSASEPELGERSIGARAGGFALRAGITAGILAFVLSRVPAQSIADAAARVPPGLWAISVLGFLCGHAVSAGKWALLVGAADGSRESGSARSVLRAPRAGEISSRRYARSVLRAHAAGLFANLCLPSLVGGDVVRAGILMREGHGRAAVVLGSFADRLIDTASVIALAASGAAFVPGALDAAARTTLVAATLLLALGSFGALIALRLVDPSRIPGVGGRTLARLRDTTTALLARPRIAAVAFALSFGVQASFVGISLALGRAIGIDLPASVWVLVSPLAKLTALLPVSLGGLGVREAAFVGLMHPFGVAPALAVAQSLLWQAVLVAGGLVAGAGALWLGRTRHARAGATQEVR